MSATPDISSIEFVHPESDLVVDRLLSVLEDKSPVQGFYHHLLNGLDSVRPGQTTPLGTVTHVLAWPSVSPVHSREHSTLKRDIAALATAEGDTVVVQSRDVDIARESPFQNLAITENARRGESEARHQSRRSHSSEASSIEAIFNHEGKWEVLNEEELLADKETEHSKSGSSYSSSRGSQTEHPDTEADTSAAQVAQHPSASQIAGATGASNRSLSQSSISLYDLRSSSPLIAEGYRRFPSVYTAFVLSVPPARLQTLLQLQEPVTFNEILSLSHQLYCNPHLLQGILTYLQVNLPFREWCGKLAASSVLGHPHSSAHTVGVIASTLSPELLPQVETGTPHHVPVPRPVSPRELITPVVSPPQSMSVLSGPGPNYPDHKLYNPSQSVATQQDPPASSRKHSATSITQQMHSSVTYVPVQIKSPEEVVRLSREGSRQDAINKSVTDTPEMIPTPRGAPQARHRIKMSDSKLMSVHGVHKSPLSPSCRVIEIFPSHVVTHTAASAHEPQTTILRTGGVTVATTIEVSDAELQGTVATTQTTRLDVMPNATRNALNIPKISSSEALMIDQAAGSSMGPSPVPRVTTPLPHSPIGSSVMLEGSPIAVTAEISYIDEWRKLSAGFIASDEALSQVNMLATDVLAETLRILEPSLREYVTEVETESQRRLEVLYTTGQLPEEPEPRKTLFVAQTSRTMSPRNIVRLVATEIAFIHTVRRFVKRVLKSVELGTSTTPSNGVVSMLSAQLASHKREWPQQLESFIESNLSRSLSHSLMIPQYAGTNTSLASTPGNSTLHYDIRSTAQHHTIPMVEPMISYARPTYDHHATHSFGGSHLDLKDSVVASEWRMESRITS